MTNFPPKKCNSYFQSYKFFYHILAAVFLLLSLFVSGTIASENTGYIKGLGAVLREQPSIQSKKLMNLSRGTEVLSIGEQRNLAKGCIRRKSGMAFTRTDLEVSC